MTGTGLTMRLPRLKRELSGSAWGITGTEVSKELPLMV